MEHKAITLTDAQFKIEADGSGFVGFASTYGNTDSYGDTIIKGAYTETLAKNGMPRMFFGHDSSAVPLGKWTKAEDTDAGLLLTGEFTPGNALAQEVKAALKHGTLDSLSIGYRLKKGDYTETDAGRIIKNVSHLAEVSIVTFPADKFARVDLDSVKSMMDIEVGLEWLQKAITLHAAHMDGSAATSEASQKKMMGMMVDAYFDIAGKKPMAMKSSSEIQTIREFELFLRDAGQFSKGAAQALTARAKELFGLRDAGEGDKEAQKMAEILAKIQKISA